MQCRNTCCNNAAGARGSGVPARRAARGGGGVASDDVSGGVALDDVDGELDDSVPMSILSQLAGSLPSAALELAKQADAFF